MINKLCIALVLGVGLYGLYYADKLHTDGAANCTKVGGVWLDKNLQCLTGKDLKEVK